MRKLNILTLATSLIALTAFADHDTAKKPLSPPQEAQYSAARNGAKKNITINYSAPSMRGRKIMGQLVPYGQV